MAYFVAAILVLIFVLLVIEFFLNYSGLKPQKSWWKRHICDEYPYDNDM